MADNFEQFDFDHYELIPRDETLRQPFPDQIVLMNSKPYSVSKQSSKTEVTRNQGDKQQKQKQLIQKNRLIEELKLHIVKIQRQLTKQHTQKNQYIQTLLTLKKILKKPNLTNEKLIQQIIILNQQIQRFVKQIKFLKQQIQKNQIDQKQLILKQKQQQIRQLKSKLLESTSNNINAIFHTQLTEQKYNKTLYTQIAQLKQDIRKMYYNITKSNECKHQDKILNLIKNYQEMLHLYHNNQKNVNQLQSKQQQNLSYFSSLRTQINHEVYQMCTNYTNKKIQQLQNQIANIIDNLRNKPQRVRSQQQDDIKVKQLLNQLQLLNQKLTHRQIQVQKMRQANQQLMMKSRAYDKCQIQLQKMKQIQDKVKEKDKRINQLQYTIIQQMQSKIRTQSSINSQQSDVQKQKNNVRNLKAIVSNLKQQNTTLKIQLNNISRQNHTLKQGLTHASSSSQSDYLIQKVSRDSGDEEIYKIIQNVVGVLIMNSEGENRGKCRCLDQATDCLLALNQEYPALEDILENLGIIQKTSNLLPVQA